MLRHVGFLALACSACSSSSSAPPADVSGSYALAVTNRANGCGFANWTEGAVASGVPLAITENAPNVTGTVGGLSGAYTAIVLGTNTFSGTVGGTAVTMTAYGSRSTTKGQCAFTVNATLTATLAGNELTGSIKYVPSTNHSTDCGTLDTCTSTQDIDGTRPPK